MGRCACGTFGITTRFRFPGGRVPNSNLPNPLPTLLTSPSYDRARILSEILGVCATSLCGIALSGWNRFRFVCCCRRAAVEPKRSKNQPTGEFS
jgi:hypothetical protein